VRNFKKSHFSNLTKEQIHLLNRLTVTPQVLYSTDEVKHLSVKERGCKFPDEPDENSIFSTYSNKGCLFECLLNGAQVIPSNVFNNQ